MRSRLLAAALVTVALAGCGGDKPAAPVVSRGPLTSADVRAAVEATRQAGTGTYASVATTGLGAAGSVTLRRDGTYDVSADRVDQTQSISAVPEALLTRLLGKDVKTEDLAAESVADAGTAYVRMAAWPDSLGDRWLRIRAADLPKTPELGEVDVQVFPPELEMLASAMDGDRESVDDLASVKVPASAAFLAFPSSSTRKLLAAGVDANAITGTVDAAVRVEGGFVTEVTFDGLEAFRQAWAQIGQAELAQAVSELSTTLTLSGHGKPLTIAVPSGNDLMTVAELRAAT
jgi:hypothetical protein